MRVFLCDGGKRRNILPGRDLDSWLYYRRNLGGGAPFDTWSDTDAIISEHVMVLGEPFDPWWAKWTARTQYFNDDATVYLPENRRLDDSIEKRYEYCITQPRLRYEEEDPEKQERRAFVEMLSRMLVFDPTKRATIDQIVQCEWMRRWANPDSKTREIQNPT